MAKTRTTKVIAVRLDQRIIQKLDILSRNERGTRNFMIEQILAEKCGLPFYDWVDDNADKPARR